PSTTAPYTTRAVVRRPIDPKKFNGTVIVEWLNVSGGVDAGPDWTLTHNELIRDGFAWIGVSAQAVGLNATKNADPTRYVPLSQAPQATVPAPPTLRIREDLDVPVFVFETETDVAGSSLADRQPDTNRFRLWEVAGTAHFDTYGLIIGPNDTGNGQGAIDNLA